MTAIGAYARVAEIIYEETNKYVKQYTALKTISNAPQFISIAMAQK